ncbi:FAD-dependent oxidoreductase [Micromonospora sp. WMMD882]|uniref:FAD-dependent monooxygenase n=1 Tax=Micromonospora sp. WMMD882 TaxID=3015151 RepID=UPI00248BBAEF|nr:FAD-dependent monooxygenase [Micromonospora sp. WMMD882]WBB81521.1 FAD-dependent oxidoreductase [Micromonospora sp. WMMD882]
MYDETTQVLVVGGGVVGLSTSLFLSAHGVGSILVERHPGTAIHPRAWGWYPRTLELYRSVGLADAIDAESAGFTGHVLLGKLESLTGREFHLSRIPDEEDVSDISPIGRVVSLPQDRIEPLVLRRARELGGDVRFGVELVDLVQDDEGVTATVADRKTGVRRTVRARYLVAADGTDSPVRERLGIRRHGRGVVRHQMSILFRADLTGPLAGRRFAICQVENPQVEGTFGHDDSLGQGTLILTYHPERGERPEDFTDERCVELVRAAVGVPDLAVELRSVMPWEMGALVAERFTDGRVFLVGDAAHVVPPVGGYGANTGIHDAHNLAWKLHAVLTGLASPALLSTYHTERHPVAVTVLTQAGLRLAVRGGFATPDQHAALRETLTVTFGYAYDSAAIVAEPGDGVPAGPPGPGGAPAAPLVEPRDLDGRPGTRAPHVWLRLDGRRISTLDLFDQRPVLLLGPAAEPWRAAATAAAKRLGVELDVHRIGADLVEEDRPWAQTYGVAPDGVVLVRPDGFVCWRAPAGAEATESAVERVLAALLHRQP